jgi:enoyl-CoA hydratase/carnithine racemase
MMVSNMAMPLSLLKVEVIDRLATITIDRPDALNSLNPAVVHQLQQAFEQMIADPQVEGIILAGAGRAFVVGADIEFFVRNLQANDIPRIVKFTELGHRLLNTVDHCPKPVVARVHGHALGGGFELALACDHILAAPAACFGFPETELGIYPGLGGTQRTPRVVGVGLAKWLIFTGKMLSANDALKLGIIAQRVSLDQLDAACRHFALGFGKRHQPELRSPEFAMIEQFFATNRVDDLYAETADTGGNPALIRAMKSVSSKSQVALRLAERLIDEGQLRTLEAALPMEIEHLAEIFSTAEAYRGLISRAKH